MRRLLLFITILLILYCDRKSKEIIYLPKMEFKGTKNPNYLHYFPGTSDSGWQNTRKGESNKKTITELVPSFQSQPKSDTPDEQEKSSGFFAFLFNDSEDEKEKSISQDESKKIHNEIQKITDEYISEIDKIISNKQEEILKV